ncbi:MAG: SAP domain-containing protein [Candidatus Tectomicrobia bacterium]|uniref:SAP domain-containing protein n=1 Tax=Tectimicrobiota bacterium TaxID=2528274 RepID=A0A933GLK8_UNCTE|nr:SAP domain-containing protein [Candidatus Tectomicrobia bacterium]
MNFKEIKAKAKELGVKTFGKKKIDIILDIQVAEGNFPCFGTAQDYCDQLNCCFREECLTEKS